jgi:hypothetical protein
VLEGHPNYYKREEIQVTCGDGEVIYCWCYIREGVGEEMNASIVLSGNYYEYRFNNEKYKRMASDQVIRQHSLEAEMRELNKKLDDK